MRQLILGLAVVLAFSCNEIPKTGFSLTGTTIDIADGTILYIDDILGKTTLDSAVVKNNMFVVMLSKENDVSRMIL